jgi:hypothetical protein
MPAGTAINRALLHLLTKRQRDVVRRYYGLDRPLTPISQIAKELGITTARCYQLLATARWHLGLRARPQTRRRREGSGTIIEGGILIPPEGGRPQEFLNPQEIRELFAAYGTQLPPRQHACVQAWLHTNGHLEPTIAEAGGSSSSVRTALWLGVRRLVLCRIRVEAEANCPVCNDLDDACDYHVAP